MIPGLVLFLRCRGAGRALAGLALAAVALPVWAAASVDVAVPLLPLRVATPAAAFVAILLSTLVVSCGTSAHCDLEAGMARALGNLAAGLAAALTALGAVVLLAAGQVAGGGDLGLRGVRTLLVLTAAGCLAARVDALLGLLTPLLLHLASSFATAGLPADALPAWAVTQRPIDDVLSWVAAASLAAAALVAVRQRNA